MPGICARWIVLDGATIDSLACQPMPGDISCHMPVTETNLATTENQEIQVELIDATRMPYDISIASARTCYSGKGIIYPADVSATEKARALRDRIAKSTLAAGHLTTRQHPHFIFAIDNVSRHLVWSFLHSHPFYNSEQVSQRYVEVKRENYTVPSSLRRSGRESLLAQYLDAVEFATDAYFEIMADLEKPAADEFYKIFRGRARQPEKWANNIHKRSMEAARYILPVATHTYMYHTISGLTLHRYLRLCKAYDVPTETQTLVEKMVEAVREIDPLYVAEMRDPLELEDTVEYRFFREFYEQEPTKKGGGSFVKEFDRDLNGALAKLVSYTTNAPETLASSVRSVLGLTKTEISDTDAIRLVLSPVNNPHLGSTLNESTVSKLTRALSNVTYVFQKKLSHTADSQDQRHRMVPGARPILMRHYSGRPDYLIPSLVENSVVNSKYQEKMHHLFEKISQFLDVGGSEEEAVYLLPNAFPVRFYESGELIHLHHKWKSRLCYNAQEEIFRASVDEVSQVKAIHPIIAESLYAPCRVRKEAGITPFCPEGDKFCGSPVWNQDLNAYRRIL